MRDGWIAIMFLGMMDYYSWRIAGCAFGTHSFEVDVLVRLSRSGMSHVGKGNHSSLGFLV
jgi:hypothetical protein